MRRFFRYMIPAAAAVMLCGCSTRLVDYTIISTKNIDLTRAAAFRRGDDRVAGRDQASIIIFIPTGVPDIKEAIDRAIESVPGAVALVDGVVRYQFFYIPYIFGKESYVVEGTPLIDSAYAGNALPAPYLIARINDDGSLREMRSVSAEEFRKASRAR